MTNDLKSLYSLAEAKEILFGKKRGRPASQIFAIVSLGEIMLKQIEAKGDVSEKLGETCETLRMWRWDSRRNLNVCLVAGNTADMVQKTCHQRNGRLPTPAVL